MWSAIGGGAGLAAANRKLGLRSTRPGPGGAWGSTTTSAADQVRLLNALISPRSPLTARHRRYVLSLMSDVTPEQAWGVSAADDEITHPNASRHDAPESNASGDEISQTNADRYKASQTSAVRHKAAQPNAPARNVAETNAADHGVAQANAAGRDVALKNGWLPRTRHGGRWTVNSIGRVRAYGRTYLIAVVSERHPSMGAGIEAVEHVSRLVTKALATAGR